MVAEWQPMYQPSREQAEADRAAAYEAQVPHGELSCTSMLASNESALTCCCCCSTPAAPARCCLACMHLMMPQVHCPVLHDGFMTCRYRAALQKGSYVAWLMLLMIATALYCGGPMIISSLQNGTFKQSLLCFAGYVAPGDRFKDLPTIELLVVSDLVKRGPQCC